MSVVQLDIVQLDRLCTANLVVVVLGISLSKYWISLMAQLRVVDSKLIRQPIGMVMHGYACESSERFGKG